MQLLPHVHKAWAAAHGSRGEGRRIFRRSSLPRRPRTAQASPFTTLSRGGPRARAHVRRDARRLAAGPSSRPSSTQFSCSATPIAPRLRRPPRRNRAAMAFAHSTLLAGCIHDPWAAVPPLHGRRALAGAALPRQMLYDQGRSRRLRRCFRIVPRRATPNPRVVVRLRGPRPDRPARLLPLAEDADSEGERAVLRLDALPSSGAGRDDARCSRGATMTG